jgi:hypothetical protein
MGGKGKTALRSALDQTTQYKVSAISKQLANLLQINHQLSGGYLNVRIAE